MSPTKGTLGSEEKSKKSDNTSPNPQLVQPLRVLSGLKRPQSEEGKKRPQSTAMRTDKQNIAQRIAWHKDRSRSSHNFHYNTSTGCKPRQQVLSFIDDRKFSGNETSHFKLSQSISPVDQPSFDNSGGPPQQEPAIMSRDDGAPLHSYATARSKYPGSILKEKPRHHHDESSSVRRDTTDLHPIASRYCDLPSVSWMGSKLFSSDDLEGSEINEKTRMKELIQGEI